MTTTTETAPRSIDDVLTVREKAVLDLHNPTKNSARIDAVIEMDVTDTDTRPWRLEDLAVSLSIALSSVVRAIDDLRESIEKNTAAV